MRAKPANPVRPCPRGGRAWSHRLGQCMLEKRGMPAPKPVAADARGVVTNPIDIVPSWMPCGLL
jgi:hypothetical protein